MGIFLSTLEIEYPSNLNPQMIQALIVLIYLFGFLAAISGLLLGFSLSGPELEMYPIFKMVEGKKVCFPGNQWLEGKLLLTISYYFYIV